MMSYGRSQLARGWGCGRNQLAREGGLWEESMATGAGGCVNKQQGVCGRS